VALAALVLVSVAGCSGHQTTTATAVASDAPAPDATGEPSPGDASGAAGAASPSGSTSSAAVADASSPTDEPGAVTATDGPPSGDPIDAALNNDPAHIAVYVTPYYNSEGPAIQVGRFSSGLASSNENEFLSTIATMKRQWQQLSFPELYVGAIRLYDLGYRDEAVYWFYTAQFRGRQFGALLDPAKAGRMGDPGFELNAAEDSFFNLVGPYINGYAFGDTDRVIAVIRKVQAEGRQIQDLHAIYPDVVFVDESEWPAKNTELAAGMDGLVQSAEQSASIKQERVSNGTEARFSKLTSKDLPNP
jgi:hypothetical protein